MVHPAAGEQRPLFEPKEAWEEGLVSSSYSTEDANTFGRQSGDAKIFMSQFMKGAPLLAPSSSLRVLRDSRAASGADVFQCTSLTSGLAAPALKGGEGQGGERPVWSGHPFKRL